jgi:hypothetical protein
VKYSPIFPECFDGIDHARAMLSLDQLQLHSTLANGIGLIFSAVHSGQAAPSPMHAINL